MEKVKKKRRFCQEACNVPSPFPEIAELCV
jgi:hypothetical protein